MKQKYFLSLRVCVLAQTHPIAGHRKVPITPPPTGFHGFQESLVTL